MELSKAIGSVAIVLAVALAAGYAAGEEDEAPRVAPQAVAVQK